MKNNKKLIVSIMFILTLILLVGCGKKHVVSFDADNNTEIVKVEVKNKAKVEKPTDPVKENYLFMGWTLNGEVFDFESEITGDITLVGSWDIIKSTVSFDTLGGSKVEDVLVDYDTKLTKPTDPEKAGYTFVGWTLDGKAFDFNTKVVKDLTLKALWEEAKLTVSFDTLGGTQIADVIVGYEEKVVRPADPEKADYKFIGWTLDGEVFDFETKIVKDINLKALWELEHKVIYDFNYDNLIEEKVATPGELLSGILVEERIGYKFLGWFTNRAFTRSWNMEKDLMPEGTLNLYARWDTVPVIEGVEDITHYIGDEFPDLMLGVEAYDVYDGALDVELNEGNLNFLDVGVYEITYKAINLAGNETVLTSKVTVIYINRLVIEEGSPQKLYLQVEEQVLGFYIELKYEGELSLSDVKVSINGWISDVNIEDGIIKIVATGLNEIDAYLLLEILTINSSVDLEVEKIIVDTIKEEGLVIK